MTIVSLEDPVSVKSRGPAFFAAGFRPFFLFAALQAALMVPLWLAVFFGVLPLGGAWNPVVWHAHAMVFGFAGAAIGGFLLTAVPSWTGTPHVHGAPLAGLFALWLAGRGVMLAAGSLPPMLVAVVELAYLPVLAVLVARPLVRAGKRRNMVFLAILALLWLADLCTHLERVAGTDTGLKGVYLGLFLVLLMIVMVGGRIIPSFTRNYLRLEGVGLEVRSRAWIEKGGAPASLILAALAHLAAPASPGAGGLALAAAVVHGIRLSGWRGFATRSHPILWVLHLGYGWLVAGLALLGFAAFIPALPLSAAVHALTAGSVGTMILAVMSRAALGHSGRSLQVAPATVAAYYLVSGGAALRVAAPLFPDGMADLTLAGGVAWTLAWAVFAAVYGPIVTRVRADGRPG